MTKDEALKMALEALELSRDDVNEVLCGILPNAGYKRYDTRIAEYQEQLVKHDSAITAIKEALAQPNEFNPDWDAMAVMVEEQQRMAKRIAELEAQPEQEPDDLTIAYMAGFSRGKDLAPQRTWVGLTDEEIQYCVELKNPEAIAEEVEAKLKEKNT